jgi:serine/threonine protein kinase
MVMEFVPGETLQERLKRLNESQRRMSLEDTLKTTINICEALSYSHKRGMVHRDIKPANIMMDVNNQAILMDFGIVKIIGGTMHTVTGAVMGTARYMPPEVVRSEPADQRSDIYALGITLYEMLSGKPPFEANSAMTVMMMHLNDPIPDIRSIRADLDPQLMPVLMKALAKDREQRYASADEFAADLRRILNHLNMKSSAGYESEPTIYPAAMPMPSQPYMNPDDRISQSGQANPLSRPNPLSTPMLDQHTNYEVPVSRISTRLNPETNAQSNFPQSSISPPQKSRRWMWFVGFGMAAILMIVGLLVVGSIVLSKLSGGQSVGATETQVAAQIIPANNTPISAANLVEPTNTNVPVVVPATAIPQNTATLAPTTVQTTPTPTYPPLYVKINEISLTSSNQYQVAYETFGFTEVLPGQHIHFFFDTVKPEDAGMPGSGPWVLYGGPRPFTGYSVYQKPKDATQMCALVANANHSVVSESGNCMDLPLN